MKYWILFSFLIISTYSLACETCNIYLNISPNDYKNSFGAYINSGSLYRTFDQYGVPNQKHFSGIGTNGIREIQENYNRLELRGNIYFKERWNTQIILPYVNNYNTNDEIIQFDIYGMGDAVILQNYQLLNSKRKEDTSAFVQRLTIGTGLKIPTGSTNKSFENGKPNIDLQPGSGSLDLLFSTIYSIRYKSFGCTAYANYKARSKNSDFFKYGNTVNTSLNLFYLQKWKTKVISPFVGILYEQASKDKDNNFEIIDSGRNTAFINTGLKLYTKWINLSFEYQSVVINQTNTENQLLSQNRLIAGLNINF